LGIRDLAYDNYVFQTSIEMYQTDLLTVVTGPDCFRFMEISGDLHSFDVLHSQLNANNN